jgi:hypothetical protein
VNRLGEKDTSEGARVSRSLRWIARCLDQFVSVRAALFEEMEADPRARAEQMNGLLVRLGKSGRFRLLQAEP